MEKTIIKTDNPKWDLLFDEGVGYILYKWMVKKQKTEIGIFFEDYLQSKLLEKNPTLSNLHDSVYEVYCEFLEELSDMPNQVLYFDDNSYEEVKYYDIIKKHIKAGNIFVNAREYELDLFSLSESIDDLGNLIVEDVVFNDLSKWFIENVPDWKEELKHYYDYDKDMEEFEKESLNRHRKLTALLDKLGTDIFGSNL